MIKKIIDVGKTSRGVILPKTWLLYFERQTGQTIMEVSVEVNSKLIIAPVLKESFLKKQIK